MPQPVIAPSHYIPRTNATHDNLHIRSAHDAHVVFEAVRRGWLPMVLHRLSTVDCECLRPGQVFCWEQDNGESGIERWTDGRKWSSSRARDNFLFYIENANRAHQAEGESTSGSTRNYQIDNRRRASWDFRNDEKSSGFTKQTYSAWIALEPGAAPRRWNLTAYFTGDRYLELPTVATDPILSQITVPPNIYTTVQSLLRKSERRANAQEILREPAMPASTQDIESPGSRITSPSRDQYSPPNLAIPNSPTSLAHGNGGYQPSDMAQAQRSTGHPQPRSLEDQRAIAAFKLQL
ncbi:hypothetical protein FRC09_017710 [Ceratobasidium sp. 395]|nr:hypothetical protein FRC09_017710 [Ceratobasidium sp. 395]